MAFDWAHYLVHTWKREGAWSNSVTINRKAVGTSCEVCWEIWQLKNPEDPECHEAHRLDLNFQWSLLEWLEHMPLDEIPLALAGGGLSSQGPNWETLWNILAIPFLTARLNGAIPETQDEND